MIYQKLLIILAVSFHFLVSNKYRALRWHQIPHWKLHLQYKQREIHLEVFVKYWLVQHYFPVVHPQLICYRRLEIYLKCHAIAFYLTPSRNLTLQ